MEKLREGRGLILAIVCLEFLLSSSIRTGSIRVALAEFSGGLEGTIVTNASRYCDPSKEEN